MARQKKFYFIALTIFFISFCYGDIPLSAIVGKWEGTTPTNDKVILQFNKDDTAVWTVVSEKRIFSTDARYSINILTKPIQIKLYNFSDPSLKKFIFLGILEFTHKNKILFFGKPVKTNQEEENYPESCGVDSLELGKQTKTVH